MSDDCDRELSSVEMWGIIGNAANFIVGIATLISIFFLWQSASVAIEAVKVTKDIFIEENRPRVIAQENSLRNSIGDDYLYYENNTKSDASDLLKMTEEEIMDNQRIRAFFDFRIENIGKVPAYFYVHPTRLDGADLSEKELKTILATDNCSLTGVIVPGEVIRTCGLVSRDNPFPGTLEPFDDLISIDYGPNLNDQSRYTTKIQRSLENVIDDITHIPTQAVRIKTVFVE